MKVYVITNLVNGKQYVGITRKTVDERFRQHLAEARWGNKRALLNAIRKYGEGAFCVREIASAENWKSLCEIERKLIVEMKTAVPFGYNMTAGGDGVEVLSPESIDRIKNSMKGRTHSDEARRKIGLASKGRPKSSDTKAKISAAHSGKTLTEEHKAKLSAAKMGRKMPPRSRDHAEKISAGLRAAWERRRAGK